MLFRDMAVLGVLGFLTDNESWCTQTTFGLGLRDS